MGVNPVTQASLLKCSFGSAPGVEMVQSQPLVNMGKMKAATIMDNKLLFFGTCSSPAHPVVALTGAPGPCLGPAMIIAPWVPGSATVKVCKLPAAHKNCKLICNLGGVIEMQTSIAVTVKVGG